MNDFGGPWTEKKLEALKDYLQAYMTIMRGNDRAKSFRTTYFDGFAGSGSRVLRQGEPDQDRLELAEEGTEEFAAGSARIALSLAKPFDQYVFVDSRRQCVEALTALARGFPQLSIQVRQGDANAEATTWVRGLQAHDRALVFLDPYGMQVEWSTLEALANSRKVDLWLLFPLGQAVARLLTRGGEPPPAWANALDRCFGTPEWRTEFYKPSTQETLFGEEAGVHRMASYEGITSYMVRRLKTCFADVLDSPIVLRNRTGIPIYLLCFAVSNEAGAKPALRIAGHIARKLNDAS